MSVGTRIASSIYDASRRFHAVFNAIGGALSFFAFVGLSASALYQLLKRDFIGAWLVAIGEVFDIFNEVFRHSQAIVALWDAHVIVPVHSWLSRYVEIDLPVWVIEVSTLVLFAIGPTVRARLTSMSLRRQIGGRLAAVMDLRHARTLQLKEQEEEEAIRASIRKEIGSQRRKKWLGALGASMGVVAEVMNALNLRANNIGQSSRNAVVAWRGIQSGANDVQSASRDIDRLTASINARAGWISAAKQRIEALELEDDGLIKKLENEQEYQAKAIVTAYVRERLRHSITISRLSLGILSAVVISYLIDWVVY